MTEVPYPGSEDGVSVVVNCDDAVSVTVPVKPLRALMIMVEVTEPPAVTVEVDGLAEMVKSGSG
jgi:hypothetical protein